MIPFAAYTAADSQCFSTERTTPKVPPFREGSRPSSSNSSLNPLESTRKWHLDRFTSYCRAHGRDQQRDRQTDRQTDRPRYCVCNNRPHLLLRCGLKTSRCVTSVVVSKLSLHQFDILLNRSCSSGVVILRSRVETSIIRPMVIK